MVKTTPKPTAQSKKPSTVAAALKQEPATSPAVTTTKPVAQTNDLVMALTSAKLLANARLDTVAADVMAHQSTLAGLEAEIDDARAQLYAIHEVQVQADTLVTLHSLVEQTEKEAQATRSALHVERLREEDQFQYDLRLKRRTEADQWAQAQAKKTAEYQFEFTQKVKELEARESQVKFNEELMTKHAKDAAESTAAAEKLRSELAQLRAIETRVRHEHALALMDAQNTIKMSKQTELHLVEQTQGLLKERDSHKASAEAAALRVQEIAAKAVDGAGRGGYTPMLTQGYSDPRMEALAQASAQNKRG